MPKRSAYFGVAERLPFGVRKERLAVIYLGRRGTKLTEWIGTSQNGKVHFSIPAIMATAKATNSSSVVLVHNHPSGVSRPSIEDAEATVRVQRAAERAGVTLKDHLVVAKGKAHSILGKKAAKVKRCTLCIDTVSDVPHRTMDHRREAHIIAKQIRRKEEKYSNALRRAWDQIKASSHWRETRPAAPKEKLAKTQKAVPRPTKTVLGPKPKNSLTGIGDTTTATGPDPSKVYEFRYRILPLELVEPSHKDNLERNPRFPKELQPRLRDRAASRLQIRTMAQNLDPKALLLDFHTLDRGPMIVGPDEGSGFPVESGNGRTIALRIARSDFPNKYREYQTFLMESIGQYGINPDQLQQIDHPVLVRERLTDVDRVAFAEEANAATAMQMSPLEVALTDAKKLNDETLATLEVGDNQTIDQALQSAANHSLVSGFLGKLPANERAALVDAGGRLNQVGLQRLKSAMFAKVYPGDAGIRLTRTFIESLDPTLKNVESAMFDSLPQMARAEGLVNSGQRVADLTIGQDLAEVVDKLAALKQQRIIAADFIRQATFTVRDLTPSQEKMLVHLEQFGRSRKAIREFLRGYAEAVIASPHPDQGAMFASAQESKGDIVSRLVESQAKKSSGDLFDLIEARERAGMVGDPLRRYPRWTSALR